VVDILDAFAHDQIARKNVLSLGRPQVTVATSNGVDLRDHSVLITGGGSGIGFAITKAALAAGATVTIASRTEERLLEAVERLEELGFPGERIHYVSGDASQEPDVQRMVATATGVAGRLDAVVACAGEPRGQMAPVTHLELDAWESVFQNNARATMLTLKYGARALVRAGGGAFVAISSISSTMAAPFTAPIASAKAAVDQLCRVAANELGPSNVRVNSVRPGLIQVERQDLPAEIVSDFQSAVPMPRLGTGADIAALVSLLISPSGSWITGQVLTVDGGQTVRRAFDATPWVEPVYGTDGMRGVVEETTAVR
jgi:NAD(P)-dependent dehydrogenase (short-subunit alcohol dehydrogenase family)